MLAARAVGDGGSDNRCRPVAREPIDDRDCEARVGIQGKVWAVLLEGANGHDEEATRRHGRPGATSQLRFLHVLLVTQDLTTKVSRSGTRTALEPTRSKRIVPSGLLTKQPFGNLLPYCPQ